MCFRSPARLTHHLLLRYVASIERDRPAPRERHRARNWDEWINGVLSARFVPLDLADVIQMALTYAVESALGNDEVLAQAAGENLPGQRRRGYDLVARSAGMARETLRLTSQGARWAQADEIAGIEASPLTGEHFRGHLLALVEQVLHKDQVPGRMPKSSLASNRVGTSTDPLEAAMKEVPELEERVRTDVARLDWTQQLAARQQRRAGTANWGRVRSLIGPDPVPKTTPGGMNERLRAAGVPNLTQLLRDLLGDSTEFPTYKAVQAVQRDHPHVTAKQVQDAITRLVARGELRTVRRGIYQPTDAMRGRRSR